MRIDVYEDNAGGLHMTDGITWVSGFERQGPGTLVADVTSWDIWIDDATGVRPYGPGLIDGLERIAAYDGSTLTLEVGRLGEPGRRYAGVEL
jgi:hypothetical protein